jgi:hypothetical protein
MMAKGNFLSFVTLGQDQFLQFLEGQTHPAKFELNDGIWVVRYMQDHPRQNLRLASELVSYRIAKMLGVCVPDFKIMRIDKSFNSNHQDGKKEIEVQAGFATACKWLDNGRCPDLEKEPLGKFWEEEHYLEIVARARTADTWIRNFDRKKVGNVILTGSLQAPQVWFLDFDQSFLAKGMCPIHGFRIHWCEKAFKSEWLDDTEVLSGFDGTGSTKCESVQRLHHFKPVLERLKNISDERLKKILQEIPSEWSIPKKALQQWLNGLLHRRSMTIGNIEKRYPQ